MTTIYIGECMHTICLRSQVSYTTNTHVYYLKQVVLLSFLASSNQIIGCKKQKQFEELDISWYLEVYWLMT